MHESCKGCPAYYEARAREQAYQQRHQLAMQLIEEGQPFHELELRTGITWRMYRALCNLINREV